MVALGVAGLLAVAGPAGAQPPSISVGSTGNPFGPGGSGPFTSVDFGVNVSGVLVVSFHGDPGTGCAARGLCDYSGLVSEELGNQASLSVDTLGNGKGLSNRATLYFGGAPSGYTVADVDRTSGGRVVGHCVDVQQPFFSAADSGNGVIAVSPLQAGSDALSTRCAGPLYRDLERAVPRTTVSVKRLIRRGERIDLSGTHAFAGGGFAGTVHSTIVLQIGGRNGGGTSSGPTPRGSKGVRIRTVDEALHVVSSSGQLSATVRGTSDPYECSLLDSCGLTGTLTAPLTPSRPEAGMSAFGPAKRPYRDFLKALGLGSKGDSRGIQVYGNINWSGGLFTEAIDHGGRCSDMGPMDGGEVTLNANKRGLVADYVISPSLRTRCPGPSPPPNGWTVARGRVGSAELRQRTFTLRLAGSSAFADQGYSVVSHSRLSLVLRRGRVTQRVFTQPA